MKNNEAKNKLEIKLEKLKHKLIDNININNFIESDFLKTCDKNISNNSAYPYFQPQHIKSFFKLNNKGLEKKIEILKSKINNFEINSNIDINKTKPKKV